MKTAMTVLQEMGVKLGTIPEYECILQAGPQHQLTFEYRCTAFGESAIGVARSKKEAKQEAARAVLARLAGAGHAVPPPWGLARAAPDAAPAPRDVRSYVALLKEFCDEYKLFTPEITLVGDTGPPHLRSFTMRATVGAHSRDATALNKKVARQLAAEAIYKYLRGCLRSTRDFVEEDALARSYEKEMGRYTEPEDRPWRPPLTQKLSEYQCGLVLQFEEGRRVSALEALRSTAASGRRAEERLAYAASALGVEPQWSALPTRSGAQLVTVELPRTSPALVHMGRDRDDAAQRCVDYLLLCLVDPPTDPLLNYKHQLANEQFVDSTAID